MIEEKIQKILEELYVLDPTLKEKEAEISEIINKFLQFRPEIKIDRQFVSKLKMDLLEKAEEVKNKKSFISNIINFSNMKKTNYIFAGIAGFILIVGVLFASTKQEQKKFTDILKGKNQNAQTSEEVQNAVKNSPIGSKQVVESVSSVKKFASVDEFKKYLEDSQSQSSSGGYGMGGGREVMLANPAPMALDSTGNAASKSMAPLTQESNSSLSYSERSSETNVQVKGIDEPDIVKTDGQNLYVSMDQPWVYYEVMSDMKRSPDAPANSTVDIMPPYKQPVNQTKVVSALPPSELKQIGKIDQQGEMLISGNNLMVFTYEAVYGYNISNPKDPKQTWKIKYENNSQLASARLYNGKIYLVTSSYPNFEVPCPIRPLSLNDKKIEIPCTDIYHPIVPITDTVTYNAFQIDPQNGEVKDKLSFVGSSGQAVVYMSQSALYVTYNYLVDQTKIAFDFFSTSGKGIFPETVTDKINKLKDYDISQAAKNTELQQILQKYYNGIDQDQSTKLQNDLNNKASEYLKAHIRDLQFTGIVKIPLSKFEVSEVGNVPGVPLNQFSLDEYNGSLRIATTIGQAGLWSLGIYQQQETLNDVYVLNGNLDVTGKVTDLGKGERIYSARFINDKGYLVTFKQTDPFYVLDLSDPKNPSVKGELKIPGYSSYLHPLAQNRILGIGQENSQVKISLFDVSDPANPKEIDKYLLNEYWTDVSNNHHAFLQDEKHSVFFLPGSSNEYIFSYKNDKLSLEKAVSGISQVKRAVYINDAMYIIGLNNIVVVDENDWKRIGELAF